MISQRDILLVPFPFSDQTGNKVRPVSVISNNEFNKSSEDLIVAGITSNLLKDQYTISLSPSDLESGVLRHESCIKVENILRIDRDLVIKNIGKIKKGKFRDVVGILDDIFKID